MTFATANYDAWYYQVDGSSSFILISEPDINLKLLDVNYATFISPVKIAVGTVVTLFYVQKQPAFYGKVTQCKQLNKTIDNKTRYEIELAEPAADLKNKYMTSSSISGIFIRNDTSNRNLGQYVATFLSGLDGEWQDISDATIKYQTTLPIGNNVPIPAMGFSCCTVWSALQRLVIDQFNYGIWFSYVRRGSSVQYQLKYGESNNIFNNWPLPLSVKTIENGINYAVDGVIVYGDSNSTRAMSPQGVSFTPDSKIICYRYSGCQSVEELQSIANRIYADRSSIRTRYEIEFPVTVDMLKIQEGDIINIGDTANGLPLDGYGVKDVRISTEKVIVGIGAANVTIFDILADRLSVIDGDIINYDTLTFDANNVTLTAGTGDEVWGPTRDIEFNIEGSTFFGDFNITPDLAPPGSEGSGAFTCFMLCHSTSDLTLQLTPATYDLIVNDSGDPIDEYFPWSWKWVELEATYIFDSSTSVGSIAKWECEWGDMTVYDDGGTQTSSSTRRTITHKWFIGAYDSVATSNPKIMVYKTNGTTVKLKDVYVAVRVYYDGDVINDPDYLYDGKVQIKFKNSDDDDITNWTTIYDIDDINSYMINGKFKTWNMSQLGLTLSSLNVGTYKISMRCMGDEDVCASIHGEYLSFKDDISVVSGVSTSYDY